MRVKNVMLFLLALCAVGGIAGAELKLKYSALAPNSPVVVGVQAGYAPATSEYGAKMAATWREIEAGRAHPPQEIDGGILRK